MNNPLHCLLAGDIGATKSTLALHDLRATPTASPLKQITVQNTSFASFDEVLTAFLGPENRIASYACLGVAGPVLDHRVHMTNLNWRLDANQLQTKHGFVELRLINDLVATALGISCLKTEELYPLNSGVAQPLAVRALIAPGSGLGEAYLAQHAGEELAFASEGGHASFAPCNEEQMDLLAFMRKKKSHVSVEQVCSGLAIPDLFAFMTKRYPSPAWLEDLLQQAKDPTPIIVEAALHDLQGKREAPVARRALYLFCDILADEAANLALKTMALGGIYLAGGLAPRLLPFLHPKRFMRSFARGAYSKLLANIPVHVVLNQQTALLGASVHGFASFAPRGSSQ